MKRLGTTQRAADNLPPGKRGRGCERFSVQFVSGGLGPNTGPEAVSWCRADWPGAGEAGEEVPLGTFVTGSI